MTEHCGVHCDVVIAGAGIAGCTAAMLYARAGLRVVLLEAHRNPATFKRACTHLIQPSAVPTLRRLGLDREIEAAGGVPSVLEMHTPFGWVRDESTPPRQRSHGYNIRRSELDPLLRRLASGTDGVRLLLGTRVCRVERRGRRATGVTARTLSGETLPVRARLVVGADGAHSTVASGAGLPERRRAHGRFGFFALYTGVRPPDCATSRLWLRDPDVAYEFPNDAGRTVLALMVPSERADHYRADFDGYLRAVFAALPDGPDLGAARRVSDFTGVVNYPSVNRRPVGPGVALIGDAAMVADYLWGVGCGWAFQSAEWLVDATAPALLANRSPERGLLTYAWRRWRHLGLHQRVMAEYASGRKFHAGERLMLAGGARDPLVARRLLAFGARTASATTVYSPLLLARAWLALRESES